ncbi:MAG: Uma2 family endonuclease, partial [Myxococcota bacterium]
AAPEHQVAELVDGELHLQPRPATPHARAASVLGMLIGPPFRLGTGGPGGWEILDEPELHFGTHVLVPDLAGWRLGDTRDPDLVAAYQTAAPHWLCEVLSPSTRAFDRVKKLPIYAANGVNHVWLVDPLSMTIEVFRLENARWTLLVTHHGREPLVAEPFDALPIHVGEMWVSTD